MTGLARIAAAAVLVLLAAASDALTWDAFLEETSHEAGELIGSGLLSTTVVMKEQILGYSTTKKEGGNTADIKYYYMTQSQFECRFYGYLRACKHPFPDYGGNETYTDVSSPFTIDFLITNDYIASSTYKLPDVRHYPIFVAGIVPIFNIAGIDRLVLTLDTLAKIFRGCQASTNGCLPGSINMWNDSAIKATNPPTVHAFLDAAGPIKRIVRRESTGATEIIRRAMSKFEPEFAAQVGVSNSKNWSAVDIYATITSPEGLISMVYETPSSLSYTAANLLEDARVGIIDLIENGAVKQANAKGLAAAVEDFALAFGNDGRDPVENTVDLTNSGSSRAWPIAYYSYLVLRINRTDELCESKNNMLLDFLEAFYLPENVDDTNRGALSRGLAPIPKVYATQVLDLIRRQVTCSGKVVYQFPDPPAPIIVYTEQTSRGALEIMARSFEQVYGSDEVSIEVLPVVSHREIIQRFTDDETGYIVLADENLSTNLAEGDKLQNSIDLLTFPYAITSGIFIYNFCDPNDSACTLNSLLAGIVLTVEIAAKILEGEITMWNDTNIAALNPSLPLPRTNIQLFRGPSNTDFHFSFIEMIRQDYIVDFDFSGPAEVRPTYLEVYRAVSVHTSSFAYVPQNGTIVSRVQTATVISRSGVPVVNSPGTLEECAKDTYDNSGNSFALSASQRPSCYPLVDLVQLVSKKSYNSATNMSKRVASMTAKFLQFVVERSVRQTTDTVTVLTNSNYGTLSDFVSATANVAVKNALLLKSITLDGVSVLIVPHDFRWIPPGLLIFTYTVMGLEVLIYLGLAIWVTLHRNRKLIRNSSPTFMLQVLLGATLMSLTVIPLAQQDDDRLAEGVPVEDINPTNPGLNAACIAQPTLFSIGFFLTFSALFLKSWRLIRIFNNKKLRHLFLRDRQLLVYQAAVIFLVVILNLIWHLQSPLVWNRTPIFIDTSLNLVVDSAGLCYSTTGIYPALPLAIGIVLCLGLGNYLAYLGRRIPTEFNESKWTAMAMVVALEAIALGVPVLILANEQPVAGFLVKASLCLLISGATVGLIFVPKVAMAYGWGVIDGESNPWRFVKPGSSGSNGGTSKGANHGKEVSYPADGSKATKKHGLIAPSLNSLVSGKVMVTTNESSINRMPSKVMGNNPQASIAQLKQVLDSDPTRRRFRRYLQTLKMDENIKFWDCVTICRVEPSAEKRVTSARAIIQTFVLDSAPFQVNLSSTVKGEIIKAFQANDKEALGSQEFFNKAMDELFRDLRQSDAFRNFLENDVFSMTSLSKSDPIIDILVNEPQMM